MADITVKITYNLVQQSAAQKREHMCAGCIFRWQACMDILPSGKHCSDGEVYGKGKIEWLR